MLVFWGDHQEDQYGFQKFYLNEFENHFLRVVTPILKEGQLSNFFVTFFLSFQRLQFEFFLRFSLSLLIGLFFVLCVFFFPPSVLKSCLNIRLDHRKLPFFGRSKMVKDWQFEVQPNIHIYFDTRVYLRVKGLGRGRKEGKSRQ